MQSPRAPDPLTVLDAERAVPSEDPYQAAWHKARYVFAARYALGRDVLDAGSGEGYGADLLAGAAASVTGVDYSPIAVDHARASYVRDNLRYELGDLRTLRGLDGPFDLVTCFEVIEHLEDHDLLLAALRARLRAGGMLLLSTPNPLYAGGLSDNPYHVSEITPRALRREVRRHFSRVRLFGQLDAAHTRRASAKLVLDPLYLRHRVRRRRSPAAGVPDAQPADTSTAIACPTDFRFSRTLVRVSPVTLVVAVT
jgi:SAM-dependent methyltransferase